MRISSFKSDSSTSYPRSRMSVWRGFFTRSHRRGFSNSTSGSEAHSDVCRTAYESSDGSTRSHTPELVLDDAAPTPPAFQEKSPARLAKMKRMSLMSESSMDVTQMYPAPLKIPQRPTTSHERSSSEDSPISDTSNWSGHFFSTNPAVSPLTYNQRPMSIFSHRDYEPSVYEYPRVNPDEELMLTITSKYPTGAAAELYVPVDCSLPARPTIKRQLTDRMRPRSLATYGALDRRNIGRSIGMAI